MNSSEKVSIYTTIIDVKKPKKNCVNAILNQTHNLFEWIIVYDKDEDRIEFERLCKYDDRVRFVHNKNGGRWHALREAVSECQYEYIFNQDFDDTPEIDRIKNQLNLLKSDSSIGAVGGWYLASYIDSKEVEEHFDKSNINIIKRRLPLWLPFAHSFCGFRKSLLNEVGGYPLGYVLEDGIIWARLIAAGYKVAITERLIGTHYIHSNTTFGKSKNSLNKEILFTKNRLEIWKILGLPMYFDIIILARTGYRFLPSFIQKHIRIVIGQYKKIIK